MGSDAAPPLAAEKMTSYAQNQEDVLLNRVFKNVKDGFYIDIGAYHPTIGSVTRTFYDRGWSGINVEPGEVFDELKRARPRDINIKAAVVDHEGKVDLLQNLADPGTSKVATKESSAETEGSKALRVQAVKLDRLVTQHVGARTINFLKIDAEGSESAIIRSTNWKAVRPQILVIEATAPWSNRLVNQEWEATLLANDFTRVYFDGINVFYVRNEDRSLRSLFKLPVNVLDNYTLFDPELESLKGENVTILAERDGLRSKIAKVNERTEYLADSLDHSRDEVGRLAAQVLSLTRHLDIAQRSLTALTPSANRYDNIVKNLRDPGGPRVLRLVLPLARIIRKISRIFGATREDSSNAAQISVSAVDNVSQPSAPTVQPRIPLLKRILVRVYLKFLRPYVRPTLERLRSYMNQPIHDVVKTNNEYVKSLEELLITIASQQRK
ncbi:FkbM family methyltransferase [Phyllobacterium trifolii]|uniref:FkbM family methyltransferase n=1 Tax=Phyllobacterium trifolii TaxID=300193 RepID=A0A839U660_9HYPH|nr:FkbM family methyltransferase [Phyllobacterium trifolii]MBB3143619.1 FkbM family methyltransferase [Phyllobacterium trifolii]